MLGVLAVVVASKVIGLYDRDELLIGKATLNEAPALFHLATIYALVVTILAAAGSAVLLGWHDRAPVGTALLGDRDLPGRPLVSFLAS